MSTTMAAARGGRVNLLLVQADTVAAAAIAAELAAFGHRLAIAGQGEEALLAVEREAFDVVILDPALPRMDGLTVVRELRRRGKTLPVVMHSAAATSGEKVAGLEAGADDYVTTAIPPTELDARLRALVRARGWTGVEGDAIRAGDIVLNPSRHRAWRGGVALDLAKLEFRLLAELARHAGGYLTRGVLIERVWGYDFEPTANIVDAQVRGLRRKLTAAGGDDPIVTKRGVGYMLRA